MKRMMLMLLVSLALLPATIFANGYTYSGGYYWTNGIAYNRVSTPCYDRYGCKTYCYTYAPVQITSKTPGWREKLTELAAVRDRYEGAARLSAQEHNEYLETVEKLGLTGNFTWKGYGQAMTYAQYGGRSYAVNGANAYGVSQLTAPQGATLYGMSEVADIYGNVDLGALYDQTIRLNADVNANADKAHVRTTALVDGAGQAAARVAEIRAKGQAVAQALAAAPSASSQATITRNSFRVESGVGNASGSLPGASQGPPAGSEAATTALLAMKSLFADRCVACHSGAKASKGLDLSRLEGIDKRKADAIWMRINSADESLRMPQQADGLPGEPLTPEEKLVIANAYILVR